MNVYEEYYFGEIVSILETGKYDDEFLNQHMPSILKLTAVDREKCRIMLRIFENMMLSDVVFCRE